MKRKIVALTICFAMCIGLWGCSGNTKKDSSKESEKDTTETTETTKETEEENKESEETEEAKPTATPKPTKKPTPTPTPVPTLVPTTEPRDKSELKISYPAEVAYEKPGDYDVFEDFYRNTLIPANHVPVNTTFTYRVEIDDEGYYVQTGDKIVGIDGIIGHRICDFDKDGKTEMMIFSLVETTSEAKGYETCYLMGIQLYCDVNGEITLTDSYVYVPVIPEDMERKLVVDEYSIGISSVLNYDFCIYEKDFAEYSSIVGSVNAWIDRLGDGYNDSYFEITVSDSKLCLQHMDFAPGFGSSDLAYDVYTFVNGEVDRSQTYRYYNYEIMPEERYSITNSEPVVQVVLVYKYDRSEDGVFYGTHEFSVAEK